MTDDDRHFPTPGEAAAATDPELRAQAQAAYDRVATKGYITIDDDMTDRALVNAHTVNEEWERLAVYLGVRSREEAMGGDLGALDRAVIERCIRRAHLYADHWIR